jgi:hypothetical protein
MSQITRCHRKRPSFLTALASLCTSAGSRNARERLLACEGKMRMLQCLACSKTLWMLCGEKGDGARPAQNGHEAPRYIRRADGGTSMMREGIVSLWSRLCASKLHADRMRRQPSRFEKGSP